MSGPNLPAVLTAKDIAEALRVTQRTAQRFMRGERCARICGKRVMRREVFLKAIEKREAREDYFAGARGANALELYENVVFVVAKATERVPFYKFEAPARAFLADLEHWHSAVLKRIDDFERGAASTPAGALPPEAIAAYEETISQIAKVATHE